MDTWRLIGPVVSSACRCFTHGVIEDQVEAMAGWSPSEMQRWAQAYAGEAPAMDQNWWLRVRVIAQSQAYDDTLPDDLRRRWAQAFMSVVDCMQRSLGAASRAVPDDRFMMRAALIGQLGELPGDPTWEIAALVQDVLGTVTIDIARALEMAGRWRSLPLDQIRMLRQLKNALTPLQSMVDQMPDDEHSSVVVGWLEVRRLLP